MLAHHPEFRGSVALTPDQGDGSAMLFAAVRPERLERMLERMLDPAQLLGDHGIRSMSAAYRDDPYVYYVGKERHELPYWPPSPATGCSAATPTGGDPSGSP